MAMLRKRQRSPMAARSVTQVKFLLEQLSSTNRSVATKAVLALLSCPLTEESTHYELILRTVLHRITTDPDEDFQMLCIRLATIMVNERRDVSITTVSTVTKTLMTTVGRCKKRPLCQVLNALRTVWTTHPESMNLSSLEFCVLFSASLSAQNAKVRAAAVALAGTCWPVDGEIQKVLSPYVNDRDGLVRTAALSGLAELHNRGVRLDLSLYKRIIKALQDDVSSVRLYALHLLFLVCHLYADTPWGQETLIDDAFSKVCGMVRDPIMDVRARACQLLGQFRGVSMQRLLQTLDKERLDTSHSIPSNFLAEGDMDISQEPVEEEQRALDIGSLGAFVAGLEDEFLEVRITSIYSIRDLSLHSAEFAKRSGEYLLDMFNDEVDEVRIAAIHSLTKYGNQTQLTENQLYIILASLDEESRDLRRAMQRLLTVVKMSSAEAVFTCIEALLKNIRHFPIDRLHIYESIQKLGQHHAAYAEFLVERLLNVDPRFLAVENDWEDKCYIATVIFISNAAVSNPRIISLLPPYMSRHLHFLRDRFPSLVPKLELTIVSEQSHIIALSTQTLQRIQRTTGTDQEGFISAELAIHISHLVSLLNQARDLTLKGEDQFYKQALTILTSVVSTSASSSQSSESNYESIRQFISDLASILCLLIHAQHRFMMNRSELVQESRNLSLRILSLCCQLQHSFTGIPLPLTVTVIEMKIFAHLLLFVSTLSSTNVNSRTEASRKQMQRLLTYFSDLREFSEQHHLTLSPGMDNLVSLNPEFSLSQFATSCFNSIPGSLPALHYLTNYVDLIDNISANRKQALQKIRVELLSPESSVDVPREFLSCVPLVIELCAVIHHCQDLGRIVSRVQFADGSVRLYPIAVDSDTESYLDSQDADSLRIEVRSMIEIKETALSGPSTLRIDLVWQTTADIIDGSGDLSFDLASELRMVPLSAVLLYSIKPIRINQSNVILGSS
eukprot:GILK01009963.1.p1 GENE.GILK01009963.1~~GILK01009963.1.p1  ORF type:complete len:958 (+),score=186.87 GILK01009963.1:38-2911(+)